MMKLHPLLPLVVLLGSVAFAGRAQVCSPESPLRRTLPVNVLDQQGNLVRGLTAADFRASFRGQPVKILSVSRTSGSRRIVILLDISGSMTEPRSKWPLARRAAEDAAAYAPPGSQFALVIFADGVKEKLDFSAGRKAVLQRISQLDPKSTPAVGKGRTALLDALAEGLKLLDEPEPGDVVVAVTDGGENASRSRYGNVEQELVAAGIRVYAFLLMYDPVASRSQPEIVWGPNRFRDTVQLTGGGWVGLELYGLGEYEPAALAASTRPLYQQMGDFYRLELELSQGSDKPRGWKLEVVNAQGKRRKDVQVVYPRKLVPCGVSPPPGP